MTIRELYQRYPKFKVKKKGVPDDYDRGNNKICLSISHELDEKTNIRSYYFQLQSKFTNWRSLLSSILIKENTLIQYRAMKTYQFKSSYHWDLLIID